MQSLSANARTLARRGSISESILSKPLERHIHNHLYSFLDNNNLLYQYQSGFRKNHSCHTALVNLCDEWLSAINNQKLVGAVFLDLRKAFDLVDHKILIQKLNLYLNNESTCCFFKSYLESRNQSVYVDGKFSCPGTINSGVPQGSILGPLLFNIHINDLSLSLSHPESKLEMFADDTSLHTQDKSLTKIQEILQTSVNEIEQWTIANKMAINPSKTKSMIISTDHKHRNKDLKIDLKIGNENIYQVSEHKLLGITIDQELKWKGHIEQLKKKLSRNIFLLNKLQPIISHTALKIFFNSHCLSHINYSTSIWCYTNKTYINQ